MSLHRNASWYTEEISPRCDQMVRCNSRTKAVHAISHERAIQVERSGVLWVKAFHHHERHVLRGLPVPFPLVDEPVVDLLLV